MLPLGWEILVEKSMKHVNSAIDRLHNALNRTHFDSDVLQLNLIRVFADRLLW